MGKIFWLSDYSPIVQGLIWAAVVVGALTFILGIGLFVLWIKYSLIEKENSLDYTGRDLTEKIFEKSGISPTIKKSLFYSKYWNHNKRKNTYRLRPWTHNRRSIWTMMEASQQAYATTIRETNKKQFWIAFRVPQIVMMVGGLIGFALIMWTVHIVTSTVDEIHNATSWKDWSMLIVGISIIGASSMYAICWRAWCLKKNVTPMISDLGFNAYELKAIQRIFNWAFVYSIANAILQTINVILSAMDRNNQGNSWR